MTVPYQNSSDYAKTITLPWWGIQLIAWLLFCVISFLSLTLWYGNPRWMHVWHIALQAISGAALTWPLSLLLPLANRGSVFRQFVFHLLLVVSVAFIWNIFRMATFDTMLDAPGIWNDFGGWYFTALLIFGLWTALYYIMQGYMVVAVERQQAETERLKRIEAENLSRQAQIKMLRYQINPHFLFNTFNSVSALIKTKRLDQARDMLSQLSDYMRYTLEQDQQVTTSLKDELDLLKIYLVIERVRYMDRLQSDFDIAEETLPASIPSMILQPLFENTMKYVIAGTVDAGHLRLTSRKQDGKMRITMEDTGHPNKDINEVLAELTKGVGLKNTEERLRTHYNSEGTMTLGASELGGLKVDLVFPFQTAQSISSPS